MPRQSVMEKNIGNAKGDNQFVNTLSATKGPGSGRGKKQ